MMRRLLASFGVGAARVDTLIEGEHLLAGGPLEGRVTVLGGEVDQEIQTIYLSLHTTYTQQVNDTTVEAVANVEQWQILERFTLQPGERREIPFQFTLPDDLPATQGRSRTWLKTGLDIHYAVDPTDQDGIFVYPHRHVRPILRAMQEIGFALRDVQVEHQPNLGSPYAFVQEWEFVAIGERKWSISEVDVVLRPRPDGVRVYLEVERRARGLGLLMEHLNERYAQHDFTEAELSGGYPAIGAALAHLIQRCTERA